MCVSILKRKKVVYYSFLGSLLLVVCLFFPYKKAMAKTETFFPKLRLNILPSKAEFAADERNVLGEKTVYLTFDDGPSYAITDRLLDILKEHDVKATFFVVGKEFKGKEDILRRIYVEGHGIGLHTYTHNFKIIYKNEENFIHEMNKTSFRINELLGITPTAIRFPGGSDKMLNPALLQELHNNKFRVYDWNVNLGDGIDAGLSPQKLFENSKKVKGNPSLRIILAHCNYNNKNTCKALPEIIKYYKDQGFEFKAIDEDTPEYYYKFRQKNKK